MSGTITYKEFFQGNPCRKGHDGLRLRSGECVVCSRTRAKVNYRKSRSYSMWMASRSRAKSRGLDHTLTPDDIVIPTYCPVLGIPLDENASGYSDQSPTLDRIDNKKGYVPGNIAVISMRANRLKSDASLAELQALVAYMQRNLVPNDNSAVQLVKAA